MKWYWLRYASGFNVAYHLRHDWVSRWTRVYGIQIGDWFIGAVKGHADKRDARVLADAVEEDYAE